jgi:hypothetical protein
MTFEISIYKISPDDQVRFKDERLSMLAPADRKRLEGRVGVVQGYWKFTRKLTVAFAEDSGRPALRILSVDPRQLERVANVVIPAEVHPDTSDSDDVNGSTNLSQEDTDNLFG